MNTGKDHVHSLNAMTLRIKLLARLPFVDVGRELTQHRAVVLRVVASHMPYLYIQDDQRTLLLQRPGKHTLLSAILSRSKLPSVVEYVS